MEEGREKEGRVGKRGMEEGREEERKGQTREVFLVLLELSETHYKWLHHHVTSDKNTIWYNVSSRN